MATTTSLYGVDQIKGPGASGSLHVYQIPVQVSGTYATASKPNFNVLAALQQARMGVSAVAVKSVALLRDYNDGTNVYTASNANIALSNVNSGSTNDKVTFRIDSGATNGDTGTEIADSTALNGVFVLVVTTLVTGA